jgi:hypothetical protein
VTSRRLTFLELESFRFTGQHVEASVIIDEPEVERAYRVEVVYDLGEDDFTKAHATKTWGTELYQRDILPSERAAARDAEDFVKDSSSIKYDLWKRGTEAAEEDKRWDDAHDAWDRSQMGGR